MILNLILGLIIQDYLGFDILRPLGKRDTNWIKLNQSEFSLVHLRAFPMHSIQDLFILISLSGKTHSMMVPNPTQAKSSRLNYWNHPMMV